MAMTDKPRLRATPSGLVPVGDSLSNLVSGLGTRADKRSHNRFGAGTPASDWPQLEGAYVDSWIARQIVEVPVNDGLRGWREWQCEGATDVEREEKRLGLKHHFKLGQYWSRLYGGAVILMITDQPMDRPLDIERIQKGSLKRLVVLDRWDITPHHMNYTNPVAEDYLKPEWYTVFGGTSMIHSSHLVRCEGEPLPRRMQAINQGWGDSTLRKVLDDLKDIVATKGGIATLVQESTVDVITRNGLSDELASGEEGNVLKRYALAGQMKSLVHQLLLDGEETYERKQLAFSGLEGIMDKFMVWMAGAADIPMTRLWGQSAAGMNATGEGDMNNYYDSVASNQESKFRPELKPLDDVMVRSALGDMPEDCDYEWNPLYQESGLELAQQDLALSQAESTRIQERTLKRSQVMLRMKQEGRYAITDEDIEQARAEEAADADPFSDAPELFANDSGFSEAKVKRDPDGKFSETGGTSSSRNDPFRKGKIEGGQGATYRAAGSSYEENLSIANAEGFNSENVFVHRGGNPDIEKIDPNGNFPGVFTLPERDAKEAMHYGKHEYRFVIKGEPWDNEDMSDAMSKDYDGAESFVRAQLAEGADDDTVESILDISINENFEEAIGSDEIMEALGAIDDPDLYKEMQSIRAKLATHLGAPAVKMTDEFSGETVMVLPGESVMMVSYPSLGEID